MNVVVVFVGGGIGAAARYWLQGVVYGWTGAGFPYGTLAVNVLGSLLIGLLMSLFEERFLVQPELRLFLTIGILGGFTTFSTFSYETFRLLEEGDFIIASTNVLASVLTCLLFTWLGIIAARYV